MKEENENQKGIQRRFYLQKIISVPNPNYNSDSILGLQEPYIEALIPVDQGAKYFVLRLDIGGSDIEHIKACRIAVNAYASAIQNHLPKLAADIIKKYPLL